MFFYQTWEKNFCLPSERDRELLSSVFYTQRPNVFFSNTWPAPATYHMSLCVDFDPRVSRSSS